MTASQCRNCGATVSEDRPLCEGCQENLSGSNAGLTLLAWRCRVEEAFPGISELPPSLALERITSLIEQLNQVDSDEFERVGLSLCVIGGTALHLAEALLPKSKTFRRKA